MKVEKVSWRGTPGVGDFMWALNSCHTHASKHDIQVELEMHWEHGEDYYHHFEDPETIIERMEYIHNFYTDKDRVKVVHVFNSTGRYSDWKFEDDCVMEADGSKRMAAKPGAHSKNRFWFESGEFTDEPGGRIPNNNYLFRRSALQETVPNRIVIWRSTFNAETPRTWKRLFDNHDWEELIGHLKREGWDVHELTYRTPVREAMYLVSTSRMCISYDGMWHYVAKNFGRPSAIISDEGITKYHTPNAIRCSSDGKQDINIWWWVSNMSELLGHTKRKASKYEKEMRERYGNE